MIGSDKVVEFRVLGPVEVVDGRRAVDLGGLRERTLLACLVLSANRTVSADRLAEDLWSGRPPPHSGATLRVYIARLRRALGSAASALVTQSPGYRLDIASGDIDAERFLILAERGRAELAAGWAEEAAATLRSALSLWRGPPLSDVADMAFAQADVTRLEEARLTAIEDRVDADLARGGHIAVTAELDGLVALYPLRERLCGQQILALYRCGRQADALDSFERLRARLADELGIDPTPDLRLLHQAVLRQDPRLSWRPAPARRSVSPDAAPAMAADAGPADADASHRPTGDLADLDGAARRLPAETTTFIGREAALGRIGELLGQTRLVTLTGPSGSGKSRLALRAAAELSPGYQEGVWLIQFASVPKPELIWSAVASALSVREEPDRPLAATITEQFRTKETLLVLDNCEHLLPAAAEVTGTLLAECPEVRILATSQVRLRVGGEAIWPVPPLSVPAAGELDVAAVLRFESARLFQDRAALARPGFTLTAANAAAVAQLCRRLDGIPLAIELAAARADMLTAGQLTTRLDDRFRWLTGGSRTGLPRHRTLRAALDWSHDLLTEAEQTCLRRMAAFAGTCTIDAVETVCAGGALPEHSVLDAVTSLVERSLLTTAEQLGSMRYGMLESVRQYADLRLDEASERAQVMRRLLAWARDLVWQADLDGPDQGAWLDLLAADHDNFVAALEWSLSAALGGDPAAGSALTLAARLAPFWRVRGYMSLGRHWLENARAAAGPAADPRLRAAALDGAGLLAAACADHGAQRTYQNESLAIWRRIGDRTRIASTLADLASAAHTRAEYGEAQEMFDEALSLARDAGDSVQAGRALSGLGVLALHTGDLASASEYFHAATARFTQAGDLRRATLVLGNLGVVAINQGEFELAAERLTTHLANARRLGDRKLIAGSLTNLGMALHRLGDLDRAALLHHEALELTEQLGDKRIGAVALTNLGLVAGERKDFIAAESFHRRSLAVAEQIGELRSIAESLAELAGVAAALGNMNRAAVLTGAAQALREQIGAPAPGPDMARYHETCAAAEQVLGRAAYAAALAAGRALPIPGAVHFAMDESALASPDLPAGPPDKPPVTAGS
jgi:predicted ATPase/DNA-binding SARP family transcriptional activator